MAKRVDQYVKVKTKILDDPGFVGLNCTERGAFLQLIILAKRHGDTGRQIWRNFVALGQILGLDRRTCDKIVTKLSQVCRIKVTQKEGVLELNLDKYLEHQGFMERQLCDKIVTKRQKCLQTRPDQTIQDKTIEQVAEDFHSLCPSLPKLRDLTETRKRTISAATETFPTREAWCAFFEAVEQSDFLTGRKTDFRASFDWILKPANRTKILEGNYNNRKAPDQRPSNVPL